MEGQREGQRGMNEKGVVLATEISDEIGAPESPMLTEHSMYLCVCTSHLQSYRILHNIGI